MEQPSLAKDSAMADPMPLEAPVTMAILPLSDIFCIVVLSQAEGVHDRKKRLSGRKGPAFMVINPANMGQSNVT